jgi:hypothetical protein
MGSVFEIALFVSRSRLNQWLAKQETNQYKLDPANHLIDGETKDNRNLKT